jgi:hypothetical protein
VAGRPVVEHNGWPKGQKIVDDETVSGNCCFACNIAKGDYWQPDSLQRILHPLHDNLSEHIMEQEDGTLHGLTSTGHFHIAQLRLNRPADRAGYMTGQAINVTCGLIMH